MLEMKSYRGSARRVKQIGSGKLKRSHAYASRRFRDKTQKQERHLGRFDTVHSIDYKRIGEMLVK